ncbi:hypothetical protein VFPPC_13228 [Pochonia chlamydosporia 170]|uniref:Uncharacterized protein n=1 Tax=Pochonia chlamydosporia 170 TaxID=1380566 RepID=A0A179F705_METCM|nr:hypothetical protein VFPPC_13228 [Pochonia chlamydosporia 170]OAQ61218.1 hypothetical protein VFPPC_13228 [Pochonia chlamydosporia 170]
MFSTLRNFLVQRLSGCLACTNHTNTVHEKTELEEILLKRVALLKGWHEYANEAGRTFETQPLYVRLWEKLGAKLQSHDWPLETPKILCADETVESAMRIESTSSCTSTPGADGGSLDSDNECRSGPSSPVTSTTTATSNFGMEYRACYVCNGDGCSLPLPDPSEIPVPSWDDLGSWTAHRLQQPEVYAFNKDYAALRMSVALSGKKASGGGTHAVKGASRDVQVQSFSKITGSKGMWALYDLMTSVWLTFSVVSLHRSSGMQPVLAFPQAAMGCTIPDYSGTPDGEDDKYVAGALKGSAKGFEVIARHNEKGKAGAEMIAAALTRPGYGRYTDASELDFGEDMTEATGKLTNKIDRSTWLHMRWYDGGVIPYFVCHDWSLPPQMRRLNTQKECHLVDACYNITIWLNDLGDYALDRTIGEGGNSLVYALSQSGKSNPAILADFCSDVIDRVCECSCGSHRHEVGADIAVGFIAMYALAFRYRGFENAWLARKEEIHGVARRGWLIRGGSRDEWPQVPYNEDWSPLTTEVPADINLEAANQSWKARCGWLAQTGPGEHLINHVVERYAESMTYDRAVVSQLLRQLWPVAEPAVKSLGGDSTMIYDSVEMLVLSALDWPAIFVAPERKFGQCAVRDKVVLENILLESAAYSLWCCGTSEASAFVRFLVGLVATVAELTVVGVYRRVPTLWSEDQAGWEPTEHKECTHA